MGGPLVTTVRVAFRSPPPLLEVIFVAHTFLATAYSLHGQEDARIEAKEVLRIYPKFSVKHWADTFFDRHNGS